jgi:branched-chain amino acid transport system permease protein
VTEFLNYFVAGIARGAIFALVALSFVIIYRATHVLNFAQGAIMGLGGYLVYLFSGPRKGDLITPSWFIARFPYWVSVPIAMAIAAGVGILIEGVVVRRFRGRPVFAAIMATLGVNIVLSVAIEARWGSSPLPLDTPFEGKAVSLGLAGVSIRRVDLFTLVIAVGVALAFFVFFKKTRVGTGMRAIAADQEAAMAQGISANRLFAASWGIAAALATLAGILLASGPDRAVSTAIPLAALVGFPAIVLGGIDSVEGALAGGMLIGIVEELAAGYEAKYLGFAGIGFFSLTPFLLMLVILLIRPTGFFGTKEVRRV